MTLYSRSSGECLVDALSLTIAQGTRVLVTGTAEARLALFRAAALGRDTAAGRVVYPGAQRVLFLPERPYVPPATLRELTVRAEHEHDVSDAEIIGLLRELGLGLALERIGGLDLEGDFSHMLSLGEQQLLAVARVVLASPAFVVQQNPGATLAPEQLAQALTQLSRARVTYLTLGALDAPPGAHDAILELHADGAWELRPHA